ncbi:MAG: flagellar biosynthetic protein FliR [Desulfobacteraceae bacterium]|nr:flagellar biosynthetic protein FliR [Desulfobacteraceae bacterium]
MISISFPIQQIHLFFFVLVRVSTILFTIPFLDARNVPLMIKAGLAVSVTFMIIPHLNNIPVPVSNNLLIFSMGVLSEFAIGLTIGLTIQLLFAGVQLAGQIAGFQMGFALANVMDPASSLQIPVLSQFLNLFAMMLFLSLNVHFEFIRALMEGFELIPLWGAQFGHGLTHEIVRLAGNMFIISIKLGGPVIVSLMLATVALGLIARTVPQMQIFIVSMPLKIILGLSFLGVSLPFCTVYLESLFTSLSHTIRVLLRFFA